MTRPNAAPYALISYQPTDAIPAGLARVAATTYASEALVPKGVRIVTGTYYQVGDAIPGGLKKVAAVQYAEGAAPAGLRRVAVLDAAGGAVAATTLAAPTMTQMTTAAQTKEGDADMITWPAARPLVVDEFGKLILWIQYFNNANSTKYHVPVVSNDNGATWVLPTLSGFNDNTLGDIVNIRGADCYDPTTHLMHRIIALTQADGGVYYRQYSFTRDGSNNITGITRTRQMNLEIGVGTMSFESPHALMAGTKLIAGWSAYNSATAVKSVVRAACLVPVGGAADVANATWTAPLNENAGSGVTSDPLSSSFPAGQKYSILAQSAGNAQAHAALAVLANGNLGIAAAMGGTGGSGGSGSFYWNQAVWSGANSDWRTGLETALASDTGRLTLSAMNRSGSGGDALKNQRLTKVCQASGSQVAVGFAAWNGVTDGDVVYVALIDPTAGASGLTSLTQVYVVGGAHSYAATCDLGWDATAGRFVATYIKTTTKQSYFKTYTAAMAAGQGETQVHATDVDEPYVHQARVNGKTYFYDRRTTAGTLPDKYSSYAGASAWS